MLWNKEYEIGVASLDEQHRELFCQIDILLGSSRQDRIGETLDFLGRYVLKHFGHEELLQIRSRYPGVEEHKKMHADMVVAYNELEKKYTRRSGRESEIALRLANVLLDWLLTHVKGADREFAQYYLRWLRSA